MAIYKSYNACLSQLRQKFSVVFMEINISANKYLCIISLFIFITTLEK